MFRRELNYRTIDQVSPRPFRALEAQLVRELSGSDWSILTILTDS